MKNLSSNLTTFMKPYLICFPKGLVLLSVDVAFFNLLDFFLKYEKQLGSRSSPADLITVLEVRRADPRTKGEGLCRGHVALSNAAGRNVVSSFQVSWWKFLEKYNKETGLDLT